MNIYEQAQFSKKLRGREVPEWCEFLRLWAAFNCLYSEERGPRERDRLQQVLQKHLKEDKAKSLIEITSDAGRDLTSLPPGDMRKDESDCKFREYTQTSAATYQDLEKSNVDRITGLMTVIYQVRCNLLHGGKDPDNSRDMDLAKKSNAVLKRVLPVLEDDIIATN
jgi:hypothetical protein